MSPLAAIWWPHQLNPPTKRMAGLGSQTSGLRKKYDWLVVQQPTIVINILLICCLCIYIYMVDIWLFHNLVGGWPTPLKNISQWEG